VHFRDLMILLQVVVWIIPFLFLEPHQKMEEMDQTVENSKPKNCTEN